MNGFIKRTMALACLGGVTALAGCCGGGKSLADCYDNCWPDRYNYQAMMSEMTVWNAQVHNGHVLDQTIWTYQFKTGTAELTADGLQQLAYLVRRHPCPDPVIFLQTAQTPSDVIYDSEHPEKLAADRAKLDDDRREAIQRFLTADTAGRPVAFKVEVVDAATPGYAAQPYGISVQKHYMNFQGALPVNAVGGAGAGSATPK
jgi:hypothetical protein